MSPDEALSIVRQVCEAVNLSWAQHQQVQQALAVLSGQGTPRLIGVDDE